MVDEGDATRILEGGSRGGGKSKCLRDILLLRRFKYPRTEGWIFRRTMEELRDNHLNPLFNEYPALREYYSADERTLKLPNGSTLGFKFAENEADIFRFRGKQAMDIGVDESNLMRETEMLELSMCNRAPGYPDSQCKMLESCNPGGIGHNRIKRLFVDRIFKSNEVPSMFEFVPIYAWDNVAWSEQALLADGLTVNDYYGWTDKQRFEYFIHRTQYGRELNALPEPLRSQQLLGRFDCFEGQVFPHLDDGIHNLDRWIDPKDENAWMEFHRSLRLVGCLDHATTGITAYVLSGIDAHENLMALDEHYQRDRKIVEHADSIKRLKAHYHATDYDLIDPSTEADTQQNKHEMYSVQDSYRRAGIVTTSAARAAISVGLDLLGTYLRVDPNHIHPVTGQKGSPRAFISRSRCPNLWQEMSELQLIIRDGKVKYIGRDHATDDFRYTAMSRPNAAKLLQKDISKQPALAQMVARVHDRWAQGFDRQAREAQSGSESYF